ncbi:hypothetical protein DFR42_10319 [Undibacterium pigrum]|uniref:Uncharacterized protein n=1 Tax=Undibacterium pigrum TaxID=401470 RepID=A0A318J776_9BURK|nr:hypothetical protein DFR42_10319 [Undibacterium pigrum]
MMKIAREYAPHHDFAKTNCLAQGNIGKLHMQENPVNAVWKMFSPSAHRQRSKQSQQFKI